MDNAPVSYEVIDDETLSVYELAIYTVLCKFANIHTGECFPNQEKIRKKAGCSIGRTNKAIKILEDKGYIQTKKKWKKKYYIIPFIRDKNWDK